MQTKVKYSQNGVKKGHVKFTPQNKTQVMENYSLRDLFTDEIKEMYWCEKALLKAAPGLAGMVHSEELKETIEKHRLETKEHVERLEKVFSEMGVKPAAKKSADMDGMISQTLEKIDRIREGSVREAAMIMALQKIEHYEIAAYGTLCAFAKMLNEGTVNAILQETLREEKKTDETLTGIADAYINIEAMIEKEWE